MSVRKRNSKKKRSLSAITAELRRAAPCAVSPCASAYFFRAHWAIPTRAYLFPWVEGDIAPVKLVERNDREGLNAALRSVVEAELRILSNTELDSEQWGENCAAAAFGLGSVEQLVRDGRLFHVLRVDDQWVLEETPRWAGTKDRRKIYGFAGGALWEEKFALGDWDALIERLQILSSAGRSLTQS